MSRLKLFIVLATVLAGAWLPAPVQAQDQQQFVFLIARNAKDPKLTQYAIWAADCGKVDLVKLKDPQKPVSCTLSRKECADKDCPWFNKLTDEEPLLSLIFGISHYNPTCGKVYDWAKKQWVYKQC